MNERAADVASPHAANALRQLQLLLGLWFRHLRRRPTRVGEAPKLSGVPTFLLLNLFSIAYLSMLLWQNVALDVRRDYAMFSWHALGVLVLGFSFGLSTSAGRLRVRGTRNDAFLEALPLATLARSALQLADGWVVLPLSLLAPLAARTAYRGIDGSAALASLLGLVAFVACFLLGQAALAWARALGPAASARYGVYLGVALNIAGMSVMFVPLGRVVSAHGGALPARVARLWLGPHPALGALYAGFLALGLLGYRALRAAERHGFDHLDPQVRAPKADKRTRDREALEWLMMLRQGGRPLMLVFSALCVFQLWALWKIPLDQLPPLAVLFAAGFAIYLGALQTIAQAGRAARSDLLARPFLSGLPLSPHQVLDGKARALRRLLIPVCLLLALLAVVSARHFEFSYTYKIIVALASLYVIVDGAVSVAFLSSGIGVAGIGGGQASSGFATQILMLPLFATLTAPTDWAATTAFIAVVAVSHESRRAARMSVRWLDDPADDVERETTVWRALLAATAFFALQAISYRAISLFDLPQGYLLALAFGASALLLAVLTFRNDERFERPRFLPEQLWCWPLGALGGAASGLFALELARRFPPPDEGPDTFTSGELVALFVTMTVVAPLVEEYFFRGWLQRAIEADLPAAHKRWAFVFGAAAFALAHFGTYGIPQLVLGLIAGWLFAKGRGLWPGILAHAVHNGVVLLLAKSG